MFVGSMDIWDVRKLWKERDEYLRTQVCPARVQVEAVSIPMPSSRTPHCQFPCAFALTALATCASLIRLWEHVIHASIHLE